MISHTTNSTTGSAIASYSESETTWIDRTLTLKIPANSESSVWSKSNEWDIVSGKGESGGARSWDFKYQPEVAEKAYSKTFYDGSGYSPALDNIPIHLDGTSMFTESLNGFYSDGYKGEEVYDVQGKEWLLVSGGGSGNGEISYTGKTTLDANFSLPLWAEYILDDERDRPDMVMIPYYTLPGNYHSSEQKTEKQTFTAEFTVVNGEWQSSFRGKDVSRVLTNSTTNVSGNDTYFESTSTIFVEREIFGNLQAMTLQTTDWEIQNGVKTVLRDSYFTGSLETKSSYFLTDLFTDNGTSYYTANNTQNYKQTLLLTQLSITTPGQGTVTTYGGGGTSSGNYLSSEYSSYGATSGFYRNQEYKGRVFLDSTTNYWSGKSVATTSCDSWNSNVFLPDSHGEKLIDYNGFTCYDKNNIDHTNPKNALHLFENSLAVYFDDSHLSYGNAVQLDFSGNGGVGVTFGEPLEIAPETFDSGVDKFLPPPEAPPTPQYQTPNTPGVTPVDPTWLNTFKEVAGAFGSGLDQGAANIKDGASDVVHFVVDPIHNYVVKPSERWIWRNIAMPYKLSYEGLASFFMDHSLQDNPSDLYFPKGHAFSNIIKDSKQYQELKEKVLAQAGPGESFQYSKTIIFPSGDLFLAIHKAKITFEGSLDKEGKIAELKSTLEDKYDFDLETGYAGPHYGYGYLKYGKGYKSGYNGVAVLIANNVAWADMHLGVIVPYKITIEIE